MWKNSSCVARLPAGVDHLHGKVVALDVGDLFRRVVLLDELPDGLQQVGLAQAGVAVDEEGVVALAGVVRHADGGRVGELVRIADDEVVKGVAGDLRGRVFALVFGLPFQDLVPAEHPQVEALRKEIAQGLFDHLPVARGDDVALELAGAVQHEAAAVDPEGCAVVEPGAHGGRRELFGQDLQDALPDIVDGIHGKTPLWR